MDGTFSAQPSIFAQLYTVHIKHNEERVPQLWCLLPDKQGATYLRLFQLLKQAAVIRNLQLVPAKIHNDFEMSVMQAVRAEFDIQPTGCLFHYAQSILRHVQQTGLQVAYNNVPPEVRTMIRRLIALPLVPPLRVNQAFQAIVADSPVIVDIRVAPFPQETWNCFGCMTKRPMHVKAITVS